MQSNVDGAYFGTTFPHLLLMTYPGLRPPKVQDSYTPRVFGFRLHQGKRENGQAADTTSSEPMQHSVQVWACTAHPNAAMFTQMHTQAGEGLAGALHTAALERATAFGPCDGP